MDPKSALLEYRKRVDLELEQYFKRKIAEYEKISDFAGMFTRDLAEFTLRGGKRFRAALVYYSYKLFGGENDKEIIRLSMFTELVHSFLLIHDDIMDRSLLRRNGETVHKIYERHSKDYNFQDDAHFGRIMAILSGDLASQFALEVIGESNFPGDKKSKLISLVSKGISEVIFGQIHDVLLGYNYPKDYKDEDILKVHKYKTAVYTYRIPLFAGAILADASEEEFKALEDYSYPSGIAFQIRDDILGVFGDSEEIGKSTKDDIMEGKKTLLVTHVYKHGSSEQKNNLDRYLGKKDLNDQEAEEVRYIFKETGALEYCKVECARQVEKAKKSLESLSGKNAEAYEFLKVVAEYMIIRDV